ncbi:MAG TPA: hypothetical protein EYQ81_17215 [Sneathiellales bacterium]|nr:hypothetical protein [Sneathiellales bacterium]
MINRILVCLDKSTFTDSSIEFACWLAQHHDASLEGMVVIDKPGIERSAFGGADRLADEVYVFIVFHYSLNSFSL